MHSALLIKQLLWYSILASISTKTVMIHQWIYYDLWVIACRALQLCLAACNLLLQLYVFYTDHLLFR